MNVAAEHVRVEPVFTIEGLDYRYPGAETDALRAFELHVAAGEYVVVVGANGSGKSTLSRVLGGLESPTRARRAQACGHDLLAVEGRLTARRDVGVLFQNPDNQLVAQCAEEDIAFGLENLGWSAAAMRQRVDEMLRRFDLEPLRLREPHLLSGGQKQRTALAGVLAIPRRVLILDEPTAMLDPQGREEVLTALAELHAEGLTVVLVTHEMDEVVDAGRVVALDAGTKAFDGPPAEFFGDLGLVSRLRLGLPVPAELALALAARGREFRRLPFTLDDLIVDLAPEVTFEN